MASLTIISRSNVNDAIESAKDQMRPLKEYNRNFHDQAAIAEVLPDVEGFPPDELTWILIGHWLDLIKASRGLKDEEVHRVALHGGFLVLLKEASKKALVNGRLSNDNEVDFAQYFPARTIEGLGIDYIIQIQ